MDGFGPNSLSQRLRRTPPCEEESQKGSHPTYNPCTLPPLHSCIHPPILATITHSSIHLSFLLSISTFFLPTNHHSSFRPSILPSIHLSFQPTITRLSIHFPPFLSFLSIRPLFSPSANSSILPRVYLSSILLFLHFLNHSSKNQSFSQLFILPYIHHSTQIIS